MTSPDPKPYTTYRSGADGGPPPGGPPPGGPYRPNAGGSRRRRRRRGRGPLLLLVAIVLILALAATAVAVLRPFGKDASAGTAAASGQSSGAGGNVQAALTTTASPSPKPTATKTPTPAPSPKVATVTGGGDVIGGFGVSSVVGSLGAGLFKSIAPYFESSDYGFVNLESPLTYGGTPQGWKDVVIKGNPALAKAMAQSGIHVVTMANNHAGDMGDSGLLDSFKYCKKAGITVVGAGRTLKEAQAGAVLSKNGTRTAFLGFTDVLPAGYPATATSPGTSPGRADINAVKTNIRNAAARADYVVVGWHWNFEYKRAPSYLESSEGKAAIDAGADVVFAHHPHLLDGVQAYHGGLIFYSLGNLVFSGFSGETAQTMLVKAKISKHAIDAKLIPVTVSGSGVPTVAGGSTGLSILQRVKSFSAALGTTVTISDGRGYVHVKR
jgi:hypothetical protein